MKKLLLDAGHSGVTFGHYWTKGKRSPGVPPGYYEGAFNREVCRLLEKRNPDSVLTINPDPREFPLSDRIAYLDQLQGKFDTVVASIHSNAHGNGSKWTEANGFTVFVYDGNISRTTQDFAELIETELDAKTELRNRGVKKANFKILKCRAPAVLVELGFMTNRKDVDYLQNQSGILHCVNAIGSAWDRLRGR